MKTALLSCVLVLAALALMAAGTDTSVTLSDVHLCCAKCVTGVATAVAPVTGAKAVCDSAGRKIAITAADKETAQKAVNALVAAGYFGKSSDATIKVSSDTGATEGKVSSLDVTGVHLCCASCVTAVTGVLAKVPGVTSNTVKANATTFKVAGDFSSQTLFDELQKAGLTGKVAPAAK